MKKLWIMIASIVAIAAIAGLFMMAQNNNEDENELNVTPTTNTTPQQQTTDITPSETVSSVTIVYTNSGFEPRNYVVSAGETVTVRNDSSTTLDFASDEHPTHTDNPELNIGEIRAGESRTFVPQTTGNWGFHNHDDEAHTGTLTVQ